MANTEKQLKKYLDPRNLFVRGGFTNDVKEPQNSTRSQDHDGVTWIDIQNPSQAELAKLGDTYSLHELHLEENLLKGQLPQLETEKDYLFLQINIPSFNDRDNKIINNQLGFFLGKNFLITIHDERVGGVRELFESCGQADGVRAKYFQKTAGFLLYKILSDQIKNLHNLVQPILEELDEIEENVFDGEISDAYPISQLRHKIMRMRRVTSGLKDVLESLAPEIGGFTNDTLKHHYASNVTAVNKLRETIADASETIEIYKDADFTASTEKTNQILSVLTLIFTFTIPPTVIGTFFGMNIPLPGGIQTGAWTFWGQYTTLILVLILSGVPVLLMVLYFRKKKWF